MRMLAEPRWIVRQRDRPYDLGKALFLPSAFAADRGRHRSVAAIAAAQVGMVLR
jgi:hypothetical protein